MGTYIAKMQIGEGDQMPIGSTLFGVCDSSKTQLRKRVTLSAFDNLVNGITIAVKFVRGNSVTSDVVLKVADTLEYPVIGDCTCGENEVISFTFEEVGPTTKYWYAHTAGLSDNIKDYVDNAINTSTETPDVVIIKGTIGTGGNPGTLPISGYEIGWAYRVITPGKYINIDCKEDDLLIATQNAVADQTEINAAHWTVLQGRLENAVAGPNYALDRHIAVFDGTSGELIADSGFTIEKSVPANAQFTDTTYQAGIALELDEQTNTFNVQIGTTAGTVAAGNDARFNSYALQEHSHGIIQYDGTVNNGANRLLRTSSDGTIALGPALGSNNTEFLDGTGAWSTPPYPVTSVQGKYRDVWLTASDLGVGAAMHFIGRATVIIVPNQKSGTPPMPPDPQIPGYDFTNNRQPGDVILGLSDGREYVLNNDDEWELLGIEASTVRSFVAGNKLVDTISQNSDRVISVTFKDFDTSGTWAGNAATATALATGREIYVDLEVSRESPYTLFNGTADYVARVTGILPIAHGGTGASSFTVNQVLMTPATANDTEFGTHAFLDNSSATALSTSTAFVTERTVYYGLPKFNNAHNYDFTTNYYVLESLGSQGAILIAGSTAPEWAAAAFIDSDTTTSHTTVLTLGNQLASVGNSDGQICLYSTNIGSHTINGAATTSAFTHTLQNISGYILQSELGGAVGSNTNAVYIDSDGCVQAQIYSATNRLYYSASSSSFEPTGHYADATRLGVNITSWPYPNQSPITTRFYVSGNSELDGNLIVNYTTQLSDAVGIGAAPSNSYLLYVAGTVDITGVTLISNSTTATDNTGALIVTGGVSVGTNLVVNTTSTLIGNVGIGTTPDNNYVLAIDGSTVIQSGSTNVAFLGITETTILNDTVINFDFYPNTGIVASIGLTTPWKEGYFTNLLQVSNNGNSTSIDTDSITISNGTQSVTLSTDNNAATIALADTSSSILLTSSSSATSIALNAWTLSESSGNIQLANNTGILTGATIGFTIEPSLTVTGTLTVTSTGTFGGNVTPSTTNTYSLGTSDKRWSALYIGSGDSHGNLYTPIYWNSGIPTVVVPVQYVQFTINSGTRGVSLAHSAFVEESYVLEIVVISGEDYLTSPIEWTSANNNTIELSTNTVTEDVTGYIIVARGGALTGVTSTDIT